MFYDWLIALALPAQPIRSQTKTNRDLLLGSFSRAYVQLHQLAFFRTLFSLAGVRYNRHYPKCFRFFAKILSQASTKITI